MSKFTTNFRSDLQKRKLKLKEKVDSCPWVTWSSHRFAVETHPGGLPQDRNVTARARGPHWQNNGRSIHMRSKELDQYLPKRMEQARAINVSIAFG